MKVVTLALAALLVSACTAETPLTPLPATSSTPVIGPPAALTLAVSGALVNLSVVDAANHGVQGVVVTLTATAGTFDRPVVTTGFAGTAQSILTTTTSATITATAAGLTATARTSVSTAPLTLGISATPTNPNKGDGVTFVASVSGGSAPYSYAWIFGDGTSGSGQTISHRYFSDGSKTASLTVTDADSRTGTAQTTISVQPDPVPPAPPTPPAQAQLAVAVTCTPMAHGTATPCNVNVSYGGVLLPATAITAVDWVWGDGLSNLGTTSPVLVHSYVNAGSYTVFATVTATTVDGVKTATGSKALTIL